MAPSKARLPTHLLAAAAATLLMLTAHQAAQGGEGATRRRHHRLHNMVFYMHDLLGPPGNATAVVVATAKGVRQVAGGGPPPALGTTLVFDDKLTEGPDPESREVGRGQGLYTFASVVGIPDLLLVFTAVLHRPAAYNGSTICLHGSDRVFLPEREIAIVGGTGRFRFAQGYAVLSTITFDGSGSAIIKFNLTILLP